MDDNWVGNLLSILQTTAIIYFPQAHQQYMMTIQFLLLFLHCSDLKIQVHRKMKPHNTESTYWKYWWLSSLCLSSALSLLLKKYISRLGFGIASPAFTLPVVSSPWIISPNVTNYFINQTPGYHGAFKLFSNQLGLASHDAIEKKG